MEKIEITVIGAGVVGLAVAMELSKDYNDIFVIERNDSFGRETSSRNSEVIHAGIYYPKDSLKARTCVEGRGMLYDFCVKNDVPHKKVGKLIVAVGKEEIKGVEELFRCGLENGVTDLKLLSRDEVRKLEPHVETEAAVYSPSTGIIDSHTFMRIMALRFKKAGGQISYYSEVIGIEKTREGFEVRVRDADKKEFIFCTRIIVNSAGLCSDKVAGMAGIDKEEYRLKYCKGSYFRVGRNKANLLNRLIYPLPEKYRTGLGIHATLDLAGGMRLGPDAEYTTKIDYIVDEAKRIIFYESARKFLPFLKSEDLSPDTAGIRPKLQGPEDSFRDFIIKDEAENGFSGFINLIGIESPGLTASLSIAKMVKGLIGNSIFDSKKFLTA